MPVVQLIRHGQASFGAADYDVLSATGREQATVLAEALVRRGVRPGWLVAGSLRRQQHTASLCAVAAGWGDLPVATDPRLDEYDHVALLRSASGPGAPAPTPPVPTAPTPSASAPLAAPPPLAAPAASGRKVQEALDDALLDWIGSGRPGTDGRTFTRWRDDAVAAQRDFLGSLGPGGTGLVFTSGGVIAAICADLLGLGPEGFVALNRVTVNTGITKIVGGRSGTSLLSFNDHAHLDAVPGLLTYR